MRFVAIAVLASLAGCVSGRDCVKDVPEDYRADVMRFVYERRLCAPELMPEADFALAIGANGTPYGKLPDERRRKVAMYATGYTNCLNDRVLR